MLQCCWVKECTSVWCHRIQKKHPHLEEEKLLDGPQRNNWFLEEACWLRTATKSMLQRMAFSTTLVSYPNFIPEHKYESNWTAPKREDTRLAIRRLRGKTKDLKAARRNMLLLINKMPFTTVFQCAPAHKILVNTWMKWRRDSCQLTRVCMATRGCMHRVFRSSWCDASAFNS